MILGKNKKGFAVFTAIAFVLLSLLAIYIILYLPVPAFASIRSMINYFMVLIFWVTLQVIFVYGYYKLGLLIGKGLKLYRGKMHLWTINVKNFMLARR